MSVSNTSAEKKIDEMYDLIGDIETALFTTRRTDAALVTRPMATQKRDAVADVWFVTNIETHKVDEIQHNSEVCLGYYDSGSKEWVSVSGTASICTDRMTIRKLHQSDWQVWFENEGGDRDGGPDDPRLALILVNAHTVTYMKAKHSRPVALFEIARGFATGHTPDLGRQEHLSEKELG
ncbi:General stress protein 26 [Pirellulimonas nuda]|uniref:General stress protein 26 n=1 Tax=Pirellulimonas nuda TaxID=2528009 RepID=A0A518DEZ2_9BACT|nr:pyridoxamine 5'-phosphate oxidase family protein [Pirellulimonas nuda]QDU90047.1 General stress protein 26 [Pirellulimonas nuda]